MAQLTVDIGGRPGLDCRGFCTYCYFKHAQEVPPFGCRYCLPFTKGCEYCTRSVQERYTGFKDLKEVAGDTLANLQLLSGDLTRITISGGGDPSCYPEFTDLIELLASLEAPLHIGYTSGKGFDDPAIADFLISSGLTEISFTVFAADPELRRRYMHDPTPETSLEIIKRLAGAIDVYAALVILPGINDGVVLTNTIRWLEDVGAKGVILMRFANTTVQGLILNNAPIIEQQRTQTVEEFADLVRQTKAITTMRISGTPLCDPDLGSPFAILEEPELQELLPRIHRRAAIITGTVAEPAIRAILTKKGDNTEVIPVQKEIADLITIEDLKALDLSLLPSTIVIPGRAFVHLAEAEEVLSADGKMRTVLRGPEMLTADGETSMGMDRDSVLALEMAGFSSLINLINQYGEE
ncbi:MAG: methyl coenzyme M reductase-arginine methyltransferase Mmp10 [Methanospirillum sp.]|uniref:methyl coenzyme M reductase-arginine methyltransferase Mmp10 n=1 Tax=Methanospirillum sp. TaxID=45200 RepID=UPI0023696099|nr:methyl coenzyme M reductase-arginine methyltransferase Mmp10 [Methanospirillum sp.]MDD1730236.1 methyl coenzyme M reductase-arginine methyltransferase Mmp10 [Methanospirillum sp.]